MQGTSAKPISSVCMDQSLFRKWLPYLKQMYRSSTLKTTEMESFRLLVYYWINFGWGRRHTDAQLVAHPHEMWLYTCKGSNKNEWYLEKPVRVVLPHNFKLDGSLPVAQLPLLQWLSSKDKPLRPLHAPEFTAYTESIPLELAKQWDLRTLSKFLPPPITLDGYDYNRCGNY